MGVDVRRPLLPDPDLTLAEDAELTDERVDTVETGDRVLIRVRTPPEPPDSELRPLSLLLWAWWFLALWPPLEDPLSNRPAWWPDEMCFKILDEDDELSDDALEPGEENELEGVEFFDEEFFAAEELSC